MAAKKKVSKKPKKVVRSSIVEESTEMNPSPQISKTGVVTIPGLVAQIVDEEDYVEAMKVEAFTNSVDEEETKEKNMDKKSKTVNSEKETVKTSVKNSVWDELKDKEILAFGLPDQTVKDHVKFVSAVGADKAIVQLKASAILPLLEETFKKTHTFEQSEKYVVVTKL